MHLTDETMSDSPELGPPPPPPGAAVQPSGGGRPWDYDTEDSGVDSVSSVVGLEADQQPRHPSGVEYAEVVVTGQKSFLHNVYGGVQQPFNKVLDCNDNKKVFTYDRIMKSNNKTQKSPTQPPVAQTAKNYFLHSLLEEAETAGSPPSSPAKSPALALLPELVQLLDSEGGTIELVGRDGTRASLKVTLVPPAHQTASSSVPVAKNNFSRVHRNSIRRSSQRRMKAGEAASVVVSSATGVRRRVSNGKKTSPSFIVTQQSNKVATLASKFNSLINENRRTHTSTSTSTSADKRLLSPARRAKNATRPQSSSSSIIKALPNSSGSTSHIRRVPSTKPRVDTIPEIVDTPPTDEQEENNKNNKPRRRSSEIAPSPKLVQPANRPLPTDPGARGQSMYGTVKNMVKQAIRKFEKLDGSSATAESVAQEQDPSPAPPATPPANIAPNTSFLWRDQKSMQNLIYEATGFNGRTTKSESYYDTFGSRRTSNAYDTLLNKSSSSSSNGYDEIQAPDSSNKSELSSSPVKYDDIVKPVTYDELCFLQRRKSNGYDELQSPPSVSSSCYIDPGSSSALGYERILPPDQQANEDEDGSTLRYEECGSPPPSVAVVTAVPAIVQENQLDSISYLYDDIRNGLSGGGSNHSYEPIYAHLSENSKEPVDKANDKNSDTLSGKMKYSAFRDSFFLSFFVLVRESKERASKERDLDSSFFSRMRPRVDDISSSTTVILLLKFSM